MATTKSLSKKRKRDSVSSEGLVFKLAAPVPHNSVGPLLGASTIKSRINCCEQ